MTPGAFPLREETPAEHIKNALCLLAVASVDAQGRRALTPLECDAVRRRLAQAAAQLEAGDCGVPHSLPAVIVEAMPTEYFLGRGGASQLLRCYWCMSCGVTHWEDDRAQYDDHILHAGRVEYGHRPVALGPSPAALRVLRP